MPGKLKTQGPLSHAHGFHRDPSRPVGDNPESGVTEDAVLIEKDKPAYAFMSTARDCRVLQTGISGAE
jgi:hypothetical protein